MNIESWIKKAVEFKSDEELKRIYQNPLAINFLLVWTKFKTINFKGFMQFKHIKNFSKEKSIEGLDLNGYVKYFYNRYINTYNEENGRVRLLRLCRLEKCKNKNICNEKECRIKDILSKKNEDLTQEEKLYFLTYVVYRYRNNIFHGSKGTDGWLIKYEEPIKKCTEIMRLLTKIPNSGGNSNE